MLELMWRDVSNGEGGPVYEPSRANPLDVGWDLCCRDHCLMFPGMLTVFDLGINVQWSKPGYYGQLLGKSGLAGKYGLIVLGGVIDPGYQGPIKVAVTTTCTFEVQPGQAICQIVPLRYGTVGGVARVDRPTWVDSRGDKGFGSSEPGSLSGSKQSLSGSKQSLSGSKQSLSGSKQDAHD